MKFSFSNICLAIGLLIFTACQSSQAEGVVATATATNTTTIDENGLQALVSIVFVSNDYMGEYNASAIIEKGQIKTGDEVDAVGKDGKRFSFKVSKMDISHQPVEIAKVGDRPFLTLQIQGKAPGFDQGYYIVDKGASYPGSAAATAPATEATPTKADFTAKVNGKAWSGTGFFNSALFYAKGNSYAGTEKPLLVLAFKTNQSPDNRQLNIHVKGFEAKTGVLPISTLEITLSGAESGKATESQIASNYKDGNATMAHTPFMVEITEWKSVSADEAIISGKVSGKLYRTFSKENDVLENGSFSNVRVKVFNEKY
jgi:hypothetical protein